MMLNWNFQKVRGLKLKDIFWNYTLYSGTTYFAKRNKLQKSDVHLYLGSEIVLEFFL